MDEKFCPICEQQAESDAEVCKHCAARLMAMGWLSPDAVAQLSATIARLRKDLDAAANVEGV